MGLSFVGVEFASSNTVATRSMTAHSATLPGDVLIAVASGKALTASMPTVSIDGSFSLLAERLTTLQSGSTTRLYGASWMTIADAGDPARLYTFEFPSVFLSGFRGYGCGIITLRGAVPPYGISGVEDEEQRFGAAFRTPAERPTLTDQGSVVSIAIGQAQPVLHPGGENGFVRVTGVSQTAPFGGLSGSALAIQTDPQSAGVAQAPTWNVPSGTSGVIQFITFALAVNPAGWNVGSVRMSAGW